MAYTLADFTKGDRVELHPATDLWMRGARYGTVDGVGRKALRVSIDALNDRMVRIAPANIGKIIGHAPIVPRGWDCVEAGFETEA